MGREDRSVAEWRLDEAAEADLAVVQNLGRFYVYDFSEFTGWKCPDTGLYECRDLVRYWRRDDCWPFLVRCGGELAGFALIDRPDNEGVDYDVGEFFILRKFRRKGIGQAVAHALFDRFTGRWQVRQLQQNTPAIAFWRKVVGRYAGGGHAESVEFFPSAGLDMIVQRFNSRTAP